MKTSHEMTQNVLKKRNKILRRRHILTTSFVALAGTGAVAGALLLTMNIAKPQGVDLVDSGLAGNSTPLVIAVNDDPLDLLGCTKNEKGELHIAIELWQVSENYDLFREYFFGTWESSDNTFEEQLVIDDSEKAFLVNNIDFRFQDFYIISEEVLAFVIHGNAESELFWLDTNSPDTMYYEPFNGDNMYAVSVDNHETAVYSKTTAPVNTPENNFLSIYKLREISRDYGIDSDMLLNIEYNDKTKTLMHDDWYQFYPVYLISEAENELVFRTKVGNIATEVELPIVYTLSKNGDTWQVTDLSVEGEDDYLTTPLSDFTQLNAAEIPEITPEERGTQAMGTRNVLLDTKQAGELSVLLIGDHVNADSSSHPGMINCFTYGIALSDGNKVGELCGASPQFTEVAQGGFWLYTDRLSDYVNVFRFGDNYILALRYYDDDGHSLASFYAIKGDVIYPTLMGDYTPVGGAQLTIVTPLSENLTADPENNTITDTDTRRSFTFDFDAISDTFTSAHYVVNEVLSEETVNFQTTARNAAQAYLSNDRERLSEYLYDPNYDTGLSEDSENLWNNLDNFQMILPDESITEYESGKVYPVGFKFVIKGYEMISHLDMGLIKTDIGWKVDYIYLQG